MPPWPVVYQQMRRGMNVGCFETIVHDLPVLRCRTAGRAASPTAVILDRREWEPCGLRWAQAPERLHGACGGGYLGRIAGAVVVTPANEQDRAQVAELAAAVQEVTGETVELAYGDQGYTGSGPAQAAQAPGIPLAVVKLPEAKRGFALLPRRWVIERSFAWAARFRRRARDYERLAATLAGLHFLAFTCLMLHQFVQLTLSS